MVFEWEEEGSLHGVLKKKGALEEKCVRYMTMELLEAVKRVHEKGIIHRDIKPENILLSSTGHIKLSDFGCAKFIGLPSRSSFFPPPPPFILLLLFYS